MNEGNRIREYRKLRGMTQKELAEKAGIDSRNNLASLESGVRACPLNVAEKIAKVLNVSVSDILAKDIIKKQYRDIDDLPNFLISNLKNSAEGYSYSDLLKVLDSQYSYHQVMRVSKNEEILKDHVMRQIVHSYLSALDDISSSDLIVLRDMVSRKIRELTEKKRTEDIKNELFNEEDK